MVFSLVPDRMSGLAIGREGAGVALLRRGRGLPLLERAAFVPLPPATLRISWKEPHVAEPAAFGEHLKELRAALSGSVPRTVLTLPDGAGRVLLLELDETWKDRDEAVEMILWRLRKNLPGGLPELHLDFQTLERKEGGTVRLLVAFTARCVVEQYESLAQEAGFRVVRVELHHLSLIRAFAPAIDADGAVALIFWYAGTLTVVILHNGIPVFWRSRCLPAEPGNRGSVERELRGSWEAYCRQWPGQRTVRPFLCVHTDTPAPSWESELAALWEQPPIRLDPAGLFRGVPGVAEDCLFCEGMIAAVAAAAGAL